MRYLYYIFLFYMYVFSGALYSQSWYETDKIIASDRDSMDHFGKSVAILDSVAVVGAFQEDHNEFHSNFLFDAGSAYVFEKNQMGEWVEKAKLVASDRDIEDWYGHDVALSDQYIFVGARLEDHDESGLNFKDGAGSVYVYKKSPSGEWVEVQKLVASDRNDGDWFGSSVDVYKNTLIVGAYNQSYDTSGIYVNHAGAAYIFELDTLTGFWSETQKLVASDRVFRDWFGHDVGISEHYIVVSSPKQDYDEMGLYERENAGAVYFFEKNASNVWVEMQKLTASDRQAGDYMGWCVDIDGRMAVAGAYWEDQDESGVDSLFAAGSAYIFELDTATHQWYERQKVVAFDREENDWFGWSVAIDSPYIAVGSLFEDEDENGYNPLFKPGSVYLFKRDQNGSWNSHQKIVASDREDGDCFGNAVSISGYQLLVGSFHEENDQNGLDTIHEAGSSYVYALDRSVRVSIKVFLEGPYQTFFSTMYDSLRVKGLIPLSEPYSDMALHPLLTNKYTHFGNGGGESISSSILTKEGDSAVVDWVMVELRNQYDSSEVVSTRSALLLRNGCVVDTNGKDALVFSDMNSDAYFISVKHRNHLGVMTNFPIHLSESTTILDFTNGSIPTYSKTGSIAQKQLDAGVYAMYAGNTFGDDKIRATGPVLYNDFQRVMAELGAASVAPPPYEYWTEDVNLDGSLQKVGPVSINDFQRVLGQIIFPSSILYEELP